jgi:hypothetical protein
MKANDTAAKIFVMTLTLSLAGFISIARADNPGSTPPAPPTASQGGGGGGGSPEAGANQGACREDVQKYCASVQPGQGRIVGCLKQNQANLSQGCQSEMAAVKQKVQEKIADFKQACQADLAQYCKDVQPGQGRLFHCLHDHHDQLSSGCKEAMHSMHHRPMGQPGGSEKGGAPTSNGQAPAGGDSGGGEGGEK